MSSIFSSNVYLWKTVLFHVREEGMTQGSINRLNGGIVQFAVGEDIWFQTLNNIKGQHEGLGFLKMFIKKDHTLEMTFSNDRRDKDPISFFPQILAQRGEKI